MIQRNARQTWVVPVLLALAVLACSGAPEPTGTPLPRPTQIPFPTATTAAPQPTARPAATDASAEPTATSPAEQSTADNSTAAASFELSATPYVHKTGAFTVTLPAGWKTDDKDHSVYVTSPDKVVNIEISFDNVGAKFDAATLNTYIKAVEANWFGTFGSYTANKFEPQTDGSILVYKTLKLSDGTARTVFSYYWQDGTVVYEQDFWVDTPQYNTYVKPLLTVANSMQVDSTAGAQANVFGITYTFKDPNKLFQYEVPYGWTQASSKGSHSSIVTFTSPDNRTYVENITYDDGTTAFKSDQGAFARGLLAQYDKITDLKVTTKETVQPDGSRLLVWNSPAGGVDGESFYETRGTTFLLLTWFVNSADYSLFVPVWKTLAKSYTVPK